MSTYQRMDYYIQSFTSFLLKGLESGRNLQFNTTASSIENVVLAGLGGSGIGAEVVLNYVDQSIQVPMVLCKDYCLPAFVGSKTLVIISSYSGNTEETLSIFKQAKEKEAIVICITSGGQLASLASDCGIDCLALEKGIPPRAYFSGSFTQILFVLKHFNLIDSAFIGELEQTAHFLNEEETSIKALSEALSQKLIGKLPIIYADQGIISVATRWRQQLNENSKILAWERPFPEMNHNELVGWRDDANHLAVLFLHSGLENDRVQKRFEINKEIIQKFTSNIYDIKAKGNSFFERVSYLVLFGDWLSWYLSAHRQVDAVEVNVIDYLKAALDNKV